MKIRKANSVDATSIAKVHVDSWRTTYKGIIPDEFLNNLSYEQRTELWKENLARVDNYIVVAENNEGQIIGFADAWKRESNIVKNSSDLTCIYLLEEFQGKGIGRKLLHELFLHFKRLGIEKVFVEVLEENKTRYFYEHYGAKLVETKQIKLAGKTLSELIYVWDDVDKVIEKINS
ncbi:GNAT family N-acetyltransferase [Oceanobacillus sp. HCA-5259]|uniref:GNAT family N-acetyltransferase n=1 Tax=Oceanobacillus sp. HCA-5259 TaxID=3134661 RepID=UPI0030BFAA9A